MTYVWVDNAIQILQSLGKGAFMAIIDLNQPFALYQSTPTTGTYWAFGGNLNTMWMCTYPMGFTVPRSFLISSLMG